MLESEREKLLHQIGEYLSIGITEDGAPRGVIGVPWEQTVHAFNMCLPDVYLSPEDLRDKATMAQIASHTVLGCYIWAPLEDYCFLSRFQTIVDLSIRNGDSIRDLNFLRELKECRMLFLENAKLKNLDMILSVKKKSKAMFGCLWCVGLSNCEVEDLSAFAKEKVHFSEFLVWSQKGNEERPRWKAISADKKKFFKLDE